MSPFLQACVLALLGYGLGSIPFGLLAGRWHGIDIREHGSRNIGATNVWRVLGRKVGLPVFFCDMGKGLFSVLLARWFHGPLEPDLAGIFAAGGCILGHSFPVWLRFHGGKGVATSIGVLIGMMWIASLLTFLVWGIIFKLTRYVSLASIVAALMLPVWVIVLLMLGLMQGQYLFYFGTAAALLVTLRHTANIRRLLGRH